MTGGSWVPCSLHSQQDPYQKRCYTVYIYMVGQWMGAIPRTWGMTFCLRQQPGLLSQPIAIGKVHVEQAAAGPQAELKLHWQLLCEMLQSTQRTIQVSPSS